MDDHTALLLRVLADPRFQYFSRNQLAGKLAAFRGHQPSKSEWVQIIKQAEADGLVVRTSDLDVQLA